MMEEARLTGLLGVLPKHDHEVPLSPEEIHVLLVDDEQLSRFMVGNLLRKCNYQGKYARRAGRCLSFLRLSRYARRLALASMVAYRCNNPSFKTHYLTSCTMRSCPQLRWQPVVQRRWKYSTELRRELSTSS